MRRELDSSAARAISEFDIRVPHSHVSVASLSGGNAQKVVLARELGKAPKVLIAAQPTRGLDVGAIEFVHKRIIAARDSGIPVIVVSSELDEIAALSDRIAVMFEGRVVGVVPSTTPAAELVARVILVSAHVYRAVSGGWIGLQWSCTNLVGVGVGVVA